MKILITSDWYYPVINGVVRSILNLKEYLENQGHDVKVLTLSNSTESYRKDNIYYIGSLGAGKIYPEARISATLRNKYIIELKKWKPDIIHSQCEFSTFMMAVRIAKKASCPLIHTYHTIYEDYTHYFSPSKKVGKKVISVFSKAIADRTDFLIAPSIKTEKILERYTIEKEKIVVIPTGIHMPDELLDKKNCRKIHNIDESAKVILYLGRLAEEKNIEELIRYYQKLDIKNLEFILVGGGPYLNNLKSYAKQFDKKIDFKGMVKSEEVNEYYRMADLFVSASSSETQGLTYYEALSNGIAAICRKDLCLKEVIIDGFNGYQYENFNEFEKYVKEVLGDEDLNKKLSKNAREYALEKFSVKSFGNKCEKLYEKALEKEK
ncbi:glycosyltransferase [Anaerococcus sp. AGMB00486]|uniref:Glycosyltransferase n=1 Tax=Anaerococcus faecalis TaxID=2742993 RepID=A0ABX2NC46_9FIRM|nr:MULTISPECIES: glycosyltransferase [Anaerococcus]MDY3007057.1 glycosyltransferase [Anaerococcus porci]NVF12190.1 glycosyltransferase [Anaerococcus faecalis]